MIYFVVVESFLKIGYSKHPTKRLQQIRYGGSGNYPHQIAKVLLNARLIRQEAGTVEDEKAWHLRFASLLVPYCGREWFYVDEGVVNAIFYRTADDWLAFCIQQAEAQAELRRQQAVEIEEKRRAIRTEDAIREMERIWKNDAIRRAVSDPERFGDTRVSD